MGETNLQIKITATTTEAINVINKFAADIRAVFSQLNLNRPDTGGLDLSRLQAVTDVIQNLGGVAGGSVAGVNHLRGALGGLGDDIEDLPARLAELRAQIGQKFQAFDTANMLGQSFNKAGVLKDIERDINSFRQTAIKGEQSTHEALLHESESFYQRKHQLTRALGVDQVKAAQDNAKLALAAEKKFQGEAAAYWLAQKKREAQTTPDAGKIQEELNILDTRYKMIRESIKAVTGVTREAALEQTRYAKEGKALLQEKLQLVRQVAAGGIEGVRGIPPGGGGKGMVAQLDLQTKAMDKVIDKNAFMSLSFHDQAKMMTQARDMYTKSTAGMIESISKLTPKSAEWVKSLRMEDAELRQVLKDLHLVDQAKKLGLHPPHGTTDVQSYIKRLQTQAGTEHGINLEKYSEATKNLQTQGFLPKDEISKWSHIKDFAADIRKYASFQIRWFASVEAIFAITGAIKEAFRASLEFSQSLKNIQAITGSTDSEMRLVADAALEVARTTPIAADQAAKMGLKLIQAGLNAEQTAMAMKTVAALTTVSGENMQESAKAVTTAMFAWNMEAKDIPKIGAAIAASLNFSRLTVDDLSTGFNYLASTSSLLGHSLIETTANMATLSNMGVRASTIGTGMSHLFAELLTPSKAFQKELVRIGLSANDINPSMHKLSEILIKLQSAGFDATRSFELLGDRAGRILAAALTTGAKSFEDMEERIAKSDQLQRGLAKSMEGPINALQRMRNEFTNAMIEIGSVTTPLIETLTSGFGSFAKVIGESAHGVRLLTDAIGPLGVVLAGVGLGVALNIPTMMKIGTWAKTAFEVITAATTIRGAISAGLTALFGPITTLIILITGLTAAISGLIKIYEWWTEPVKKSNKLVEFQGKVAKEAKEEIDAFAKGVEASFTKLKEAWESTALRTVHMPIVEQMQAFSNAVSNGIKKIQNLRGEISLLEQERPNTIQRKADIEKLMASIKEGQNVVTEGDPDALAFFYQARRQADQAKLHAIMPDKKWLELAGGETLALKYLGEELKKAAKDVDSLAFRQSELGLEMQALPGYIKQLDKAMKQTLAPSEILGAAWDRAQPKKDIERIMEMYDILDNKLKELRNTWKTAYDTGDLSKMAVASEQIDKETTALKKLSDLSGLHAFKQKTEQMRVSSNELFASVTNDLKKIKQEIEDISSLSPFVKINRSTMESQNETMKVLQKIVENYSEVNDSITQMQKKPLTGTAKKELEALRKDSDRFLEVIALSIQKLSEFGNLGEAKRQEALRKLSLQDALSMIDYQEKLYTIKKETGVLTEQDIKDQVDLHNKKIDLEEADLKLALKKAEAETDEVEKKDAILHLTAQIAILDRGRLTVAQQEALIAKNTAGYYNDMAKSRYEMSVLMGREDAAGKSRAQVAEAMAKLAEMQRSLGIDKTSQAIKDMDKLKRAMTWDQQDTLKASWGGFWDAFSMGYNDGLNKIGTWFDRVKGMGEAVTGHLTRGFSDVFYKISTFDGFDKEKHKNAWGFIKSVAQDFMKSLYQGFMRTLADMWGAWMATFMKMMIMKAIAGFGNWWGGSTAASTDAWAVGKPLVTHQGGFIRYHSGGPLQHDERAAILQTGEYVVSRKGVATLDAINEGRVSQGKSGGDTYYYINAVDPLSFSAYLRKYGKAAITGVVGDDLRRAGGVRSSIRSYA